MPRPQENTLFRLASPLLLAAADDGSGGFHTPTIADFFPPAIFFEGTLFEFNRLQLVRIIAALALVILLVVVARRAKIVPGRVQSVVEYIVQFVRVSVVEETLGKVHGPRFAPFLTTLFFTILAFNLTGVVPGLNIAGTSLIGLPILLAVWTYITYLAAGVREKGVAKYLKSQLFPPGVPKPMYLLLTPIEVLQVFVIRPGTLALRLMANMVAGHLILVLCFAATQYFVFEALPAMKAFGAVTLAAGVAMTLFEVFVALLQAYIFVILSAVYIGFAVEDEH